MRLHLTPECLGEPIQVGPNIFIIKTLVSIGGGEGRLSHTGLRQRLLSLAKENEENILQIDSYTDAGMLQEEKEYLGHVRRNQVDRFDIDTTTTIIRLTDG